MRAELPPQYENCGLTEEQQTSLPLEIRICLTLTADPSLQERLYRGPDFDEMLAEKFGLDLKNPDDKTELQDARKAARREGLINFSPKVIEEEVPEVKGDKQATRTDIHNMIQITVTAAGVEHLAKKIDELKPAK